jgi:acetyl coenzyme A synthetase (ADP forming)-like protein
MAVGPRDVILRDGSTLRLRPPSAADADALVDFFASLSERSLYLRFHGLPQVARPLVEPYLDPDWIECGSLLGAVAGAGEGERIVALASWTRLRDEASAEVAFAVDDAYQGRGVGTRLLEQLAEAASAAGVRRFVAEVMSDNRHMLSVFAEAGFEVARELGGGVAEVVFPIAATEVFRERVAARDHLAVAASLRPFFEPDAVAVLGASRRRGAIGGELFRNVLAGDFAGAAYPVNLKGEPVAGVRGFRSIGEIPDAVDLAVVCVPASAVLDAVEDALRHGVKAICVISAGFAETGSDGAARQAQLLALVRAHGARLVGPNCLGISSAARRLNATFAPRSFPPGRIAFSSQSGALGLALLEEADARALGVSAFVSIGNKADVSTNDLLEWWEEDESTEVVLLYVESFGNPRKFGRVAQRVARRKPILAMKSGTTRAGARAARSHTAALAGSEAGVDALFRQAGVIRAGSLAELIDVAELLSTQPAPRGRRVAVLTNAGGLGILCADACSVAGLELPSLGGETERALAGALPAEASLANPVDMLGGATADTYEQALGHVLADPGVDAVIVLFVPAATTRADDVAAAVGRSVDAAEGLDKPVLAVVMSAEGVPDVLRRAARPVAAYAYPASAARALGRAAERAEWLRRPVGAVPELEGVDAAAAERLVRDALGDSDDRWLGPAATRRLLELYGVPFVRERLAADADEAVAAARELGFPAVVKSAEPGAHKTERGGVALGLETEGDVREAAERIGGAAGGGGAAVVVQPMVRGGVELLAGVVQDPVFGPLVAFGPGGVLAELIGQAGFRIAPLTDVDAEELVSAGKAGTLVRGFRGSPPADVPPLVDLVLRLSRLGDELPQVAELDLNPVSAMPDRCLALDARVRVARPGRAVSAKTW